MGIRLGIDAGSRFCHLCGRRLTGRYYRYDTALTVCQSCYNSRARCARCGVPLPDSTAPVSRQPHQPHQPQLCGACLRSAPRCAACAEPIAGTWYTFDELLPDGVARHFCPRCVQSRPRCDLCRAPVADTPTTLNDGQYRCALCASAMVLDDATVRGVYADATAAFARLVNLPLRETPRLEVVRRRRMGEIRRAYDRHDLLASNEVGKSSTGHHVLGYFVRAHRVSTIYVEMALPRGVLLGTLAHELGHAWQAEQAPLVRDPLLCEGFAEWAAHHVLIQRGEEGLAARATRRDDLYGRGLRHFLAVEQKSGRAGVLAAASGKHT